MSKEQDEQATPERWSGKAKTEVILRLFRGESVEAVSQILNLHPDLAALMEQVMSVDRSVRTWARGE